MNLREAVRDQLGVREVPGTDEWPAFCFSPEHDNKNTPSASVNVSKGLWVCYSCGRGGSIEALLDGTPIADPSTSELLDCVEANLQLAEAAGHTDTKHYSESWLRIFQSRSGCHPYWQQRGFSQSTVEHFSLGYEYETDCVTYPLRDVDGSVMGIVKRRLDDGRPKYKYPKGVDVHSLLFRYHEAPYGAPIVLVEGALDSIALYEVGVFALGIYGSRLSESQEHLIIRLNPSVVIAAYDNDDAGREALRQLVEDTDIGLISRVKRVNWASYVGVKDVADLIPTQRQSLVAEALDCY